MWCFAVTHCPIATGLTGTHRAQTGIRFAPPARLHSARAPPPTSSPREDDPAGPTGALHPVLVYVMLVATVALALLLTL
jgi:hypothetical protein